MLEAGRRGNGGGHQTIVARVTEALDRGNGGVERPASTGRGPGGDHEERRVALEAWRCRAGGRRWGEQRRRIEAAEASRSREAQGRVTGRVKSARRRWKQGAVGTGAGAKNRQEDGGAIWMRRKHTGAL
jgi:hypothetical protein